MLRYFVFLIMHYCKNGIKTCKLSFFDGYSYQNTDKFLYITNHATNVCRLQPRLIFVTSLVVDVMVVSSGKTKHFCCVIIKVNNFVDVTGDDTPLID